MRLTVRDSSMTDRPHDDPLTRLAPLDRVEDPVDTHPARPQASQASAQLLARVLRIGLEQRERLDHRLLDPSRQSCEILLRPACEEKKPRQGRALASPRGEA
jgi:hypothetical protein